MQENAKPSIIRFKLMRSRLLALALGMAAFAGFASHAASQDLPQPAEVAYGYAGPLKGPAWQVGAECYVPVKATAAWGWKVTLSRADAKVEAEGRTVRVPYRIQGGQEVLPLSQIVRQLGASCDWKVGSGKFEIWSSLTQVKVSAAGVSVDAPFPIKAQIGQLSNPPRAVLDLAGAHLENYTEIDLPPNARIIQIRPDVVRITVEGGKGFAEPEDSAKPFRGMDFRFGGPLDPKAPEELAAPTHPEPPATVITGNQDPQQPFDLQLPSSAAPPILAGPLEIQQDGAILTVLRIPIAIPLPSPPQIGRTLPHVVRVTLPGARYMAPENAVEYIGAVKGVTFENSEPAAMVDIELARPMGLEVSYSSNEIRIVLIKPEVGNGKLAGKTVVVDAGHGGRDAGARSPDKKTFEKDLTLKIAKKLASTLASEGATVIMTRKTDVFIELKERSEIANRNKADFFISVHINSSRAANKNSGQISFYHAQDPIGMLLAECIQNEMAKSSKLKSIGVWSDNRIYQSGFAVLRYAQMPAVLLEMGFINHTGDRARMTSATFPDDVSRAILRGLRIYLGDVKAEKG